MQKHELIEQLNEVPIIAAVKSLNELEQCLLSESKVVFVLFGDICSISDIISRIKQAGKTAVVHIDLIDGLAPREIAVDFIVHNTQADGIISTKATLVKYASQKGLLTVQRLFLLDSMVLENISKNSLFEYADLIEILPGVMPRVIKHLVTTINKPIIAGGLISDKDDVVNALGAGATAISSTNSDVWFMV